MSGPYGLYMYALETCVCSGDMVYAVWTQEMSSCGRRICLLLELEKNTCLLVGEEYVFLLEKSICHLVGEE